MADFTTAQNISKKLGAFKHLVKKLKEIDTKGSAIIKINNTGVELVVRKDDAVYLRIQATKFALLDEINSYQITKKENVASSSIKRTAPAPVGASDIASSLTNEEKLERRREQMRKASKKYYEKKKAEKTK